MRKRATLCRQDLQQVLMHASPHHCQRVPLLLGTRSFRNGKAAQRVSFGGGSYRHPGGYLGGRPSGCPGGRPGSTTTVMPSTS